MAKTKTYTRFEDHEAAALAAALTSLGIARNVFIRWATMCGCGRSDLADLIESTYSVEGLEEASGTLVVTRFAEHELEVLTATVERTGMTQNTVIRLMTMLACGQRDLADQITRQQAEVAAIIERGPGTFAAVRVTRAATKKKAAGGRR